METKVFLHLTSHIKPHHWVVTVPSLMRFSPFPSSAILVSRTAARMTLLAPFGVGFALEGFVLKGFAEDFAADCGVKGCVEVASSGGCAIDWSFSARCAEGPGCIFAGEGIGAEGCGCCDGWRNDEACCKARTKPFNKNDYDWMFFFVKATKGLFPSLLAKFFTAQPVI